MITRLVPLGNPPINARRQTSSAATVRPAKRCNPRLASKQSCRADGRGRARRKRLGKERRIEGWWSVAACLQRNAQRISVLSLLLVGGLFACAAHAATGSRIDVAGLWSQGYELSGLPPSNSFGVGLTAHDGPFRLSVFSFLANRDSVGASPCIAVRSSLLLAPFPDDASPDDPFATFGDTHVQLASSLLFVGYREAWASLSLQLMLPGEEPAGVFCGIGPQLQLDLSPSFSISSVRIAAYVGAQISVPLTYERDPEWDDRFMIGMWTSPLLLIGLYGLLISFLSLLAVWEALFSASS